MRHRRHQGTAGGPHRLMTRRGVVAAALSLPPGLSLGPSLGLSVGLVTGCRGADAGGPPTLDLWLMEGTNPDARPYAAALAAAFTKRTGARLDIQFVSWSDAHDRLTTAMAGGQLPDVAEIGTTWALEFGQAGALTDLAGRIEAAGLADDLVPELHRAGTLDGATYGMPWYAGVRALAYRADLFAEHDLAPPTTWDQLRQVALDLADREPGVIPLPVVGDAEYLVTPFIWGAGGDLAERGEDGRWTSTVNEPEAVAGIAFYTSLATEDELSVAAAATWQESDQLAAFQKGDAAMALTGSWTLRTLLADDPAWANRLGVVPIPGPDGGASPSFVGGSLLGDFRSDQPDLAWELITMMTAKEFSRRWAESSGFFPGHLPAIQAVQRQDDPLTTPFADQLLQAGATVPVTELYGTVQGARVIPRMMRDILSGSATVQEAADDAAAAMDEIFGG